MERLGGYEEVNDKKQKGKWEKTGLAIAMAIALGFSAACEKARSFAGQDIQEFKDRNPAAEKIEKGEVEQIVRTIEQVEQAAERTQKTEFDLRDSVKAKEYSADASLDKYAYRFDVTYLGDKSILVDEVNPVVSKDEDERHNLGIHAHGTIYQLVKDEKSDRYTVVIKRGNGMHDADSPKLDETGVDADTGAVLYFEHNVGSSEYFRLEPGEDGKLEVNKGGAYLSRKGEKIARYGAKKMAEISQTLAEKMK